MEGTASTARSCVLALEIDREGTDTRAEVEKGKMHSSKSTCRDK